MRDPLKRITVRLDELGCHALDLVAMLAKASRPVMRAAAGFHADAYRGQLGATGHQVMAGQTLAIHDVAPVIHPHGVKHALGDSDPEDVHLVLHGTRLLWLHGCTALELIVAHCRRSAQGQVHFITTGFLCLYYIMIRVADQHLWNTFDRASPATSDTLPGASHLDTAWPALNPPGSRARSVHACWGSQTAQSLKSTRGGVLLGVAFHSPTSVGALD